MTQSEFFTYKEQTFDAFSKTIIRNESASLFRALLKKTPEIEFLFYSR